MFKIKKDVLNIFFFFFSLPQQPKPLKKRDKNCTHKPLPVIEYEVFYTGTQIRLDFYLPFKDGNVFIIIITIFFEKNTVVVRYNIGIWSRKSSHEVWGGWTAQKTKGPDYK
jgi:hypothetical protein